MYLISAYFDDNTAKTLQRYIDIIAKETGNDFMVEHNVPPHMTLAAIEARSAEILLPGFQSLSETVKAGEITIVSVGMLLPYVLYAAPVLNGYLQGISDRIAETYAEIPEIMFSRYYRPMQWLPHITLGKQLTEEQMKIAADLMIRHFAPLKAAVSCLGLAEVNPHHDVSRIILK